MGTIDADNDWSLQLDEALTASGSGPSSGVIMSVEKCVLSRAKDGSMALGCDDCWTQTGEGGDDMVQY